MRLMRTTPILALAACWIVLQPQPTQAAEKVTLSVNRSTQAVVAEVAVQNGYFEEQGVDVEVLYESSGAVSLQAVAAGSVDFSVGLHTRVIQGLARDLPLCIVAMTQYGLTSKFVVPIKDKTSTSLKDLRGKRLAVQVGSGTYSALLILLKAIGLQESDFEIKNMRTNTIPAAFESGGVDVAAAWEPYASILVAKGLGRVLISNEEWSEMGKIVYPVFLYANCNWIDNHKDETQKFVNAWVKAMKFIHENEKGAVDVMAAANERWGIKIKRDQVHAGIYTGLYNRYQVDEASIQDSINFATVLHEKKKIRKLPDFRASVRPEFADKAVAALKEGS